MSILAANWKMNGDRAFAQSYHVALKDFIANNEPKHEIIILPPAPLLYYMKGNYKLGSQNCFTAEKGAFTGETSPFLLKDIGCDYVLVGHSERRQMGETSETVAAKAKAAHDAGLKTIICVGEKLDESFEDVVFEQLKQSIPSCATQENTVIAYEPVWAIGTGKTPTIAEIKDRHAKIRAEYTFKLLYGGSVKSENSAEISAIANVDGLLIGGASLDIEEFKKIITSCSHG